MYYPPNFIKLITGVFYTGKRCSSRDHLDKDATNSPKRKNYIINTTTHKLRIKGAIPHIKRCGIIR